MLVRYYIFVFIILSPIGLIAQFGITLNTKEATPSYTLFETYRGNYLIDNCGQIVNEWEGVRFTDNHVKLLPNGNIIYIKDNQVRIRDWDNNIISLTGYDISNIMLEYEVIVMPNGNFLCLGREQLTRSQLANLGYDINFGFPSYMDVVVEIDPDIEQVVWMWNIKDHMIQKRSSFSANFGDIGDNPRKLDMGAISDFDWEGDETFMINGFDYNPDLDLIALSIRKIGEVILIDHSTTTEEARGSTGGDHGHGGDVLFRWGNPQNYERGNSADRYLYFQHNPNWVPHGEHKGKIMIFNNGLSARTYSSVEIIDPSMDANGHFILPNNQAFLLDEQPISINETTTGTVFRSGYTSGAKVLPNGNVFVTTGQDARMFEMTIDGEIIWNYYIEDAGYIFRSEKYPMTYSAFEGKDLTPMGALEIPPSNYDCDLFTTNTNIELDIKIDILQNSNQVFIESENVGLFDLNVYNINGQLMFNSVNKSEHIINKSLFNAGQYIFQAISENKSSVRSFFIN